MNYSIELDKYELNILKSLVMAEYERDKLRFESADDFDKDIVKDSMLKLNLIQGKLNNVIMKADNITANNVSILGKRKYGLFGRK